MLRSKVLSAVGVSILSVSLAGCGGGEGGIFSGNDSNIAGLEAVPNFSVQFPLSGPVTLSATYSGVHKATVITWEQLNGQNGLSTSVCSPNSYEAVCSAGFTPPYSTQTEEYSFRVTSTNSKGMVHTDDLRLTVLPFAASLIPLDADAGQDQTVQEGTSVELSGQASVGGALDDTMSSTNIYSWVPINTGGLPGLPTCSNCTNGVLNFTAPSVGALTTVEYQLTVTDINSQADTDTVQLFITPENQVLSVNAGEAKSVALGSAVTLDGSASWSNASADPIYYHWRVVTDPSATGVVISGSSSAAASFIGAESGVYTFELIVSESAFPMVVDPSAYPAHQKSQVQVAVQP